MTAARAIISSSLGFRLNRLSPGETLDADVAASCLVALNELVDAMNGGSALLFREIFSSGVCNGISGTLGVTWPDVSPGNDIIGMTVSYASGSELPVSQITMEQYQQITQKATAGLPQLFCQDGGATVYFWPAATGQTIKLLTRQNFAAFADLDTDYSMPSGYQSYFSAVLAEMLAPTMVGGVPPAVAAAARAARMRIKVQNCDPGIVSPPGRSGANILSGWNR